MNNGPLRILSIDDDRDCQIAAAKFFTLSGGHMFYAAESGSTGFKKAAELRPDIILLDMNMPDIGGLKVLEALNADPATQDIPVVIITGDRLTPLECETLKVNRNLLSLEEKPVDLKELLKKIDSTLSPRIPRPANSEPA